MNTRIVFAFLEKVRSRASGEHGPSFNAILLQLMKEYSDAQGTDKVALIQAEITAVKEIMMENISQVLRRGEKLEDLVDASNRIATAAEEFNRGALTLKRTMWWKNCKLWLIVGVVVIIIILIIIIAACGINFKCN
jgi:vesicle-associated membrane protein 7